jgi:AAA+ superfamily predicted ATPase
VYSLLSLRFLEEICRLARMRRTGPVAQGISIIVKHADTLIPDNPVAQMGDLDRQKLTLITEWFTDPEFQDSLEQVILIAPTMASVHESIRRLPHVSMIEVPRPDADARREFIRWMHARTGRTIKLRRSQKELAEITAGMTLLTLESLFLQAKHRNGELEEKDILDSLNRLLMSELGDKIELVKPRHSMADVIGATAIKAELTRLQKLLAKRDPSIAPTGILVAGPNGVGKTFIFEAWATECDRLVIVLKNLRGMYFGQTDQTFERLRNVLEALGNVIILVDEADTVFGKPGANTHETEARLFGNVIRMMGDTKNRGRIVWLLLTARPDNLAPDLKRSGRAGLHLPVFDPEGEDRKAYVRHILKRAGCDPASLTDAEFATLELHTAKYSPADFNELLVELKAERALQGRSRATKKSRPRSAISSQDKSRANAASRRCMPLWNVRARGCCLRPSRRKHARNSRTNWRNCFAQSCNSRDTISSRGPTWTFHYSLRAALEELTSQHRLSDLTPAADALSVAYRQRNKFRGGYVDGEAQRVAYAGSRMPATYAAVAHVLWRLTEADPNAAPRTMLDIGTGPGTALWAASEVLESITSARAVDVDPGMLELAAQLVEGGPSWMREQVEWQRGDAGAQYGDRRSRRGVVRVQRVAARAARGRRRERVERRRRLARARRTGHARGVQASAGIAQAVDRARRAHHRAVPARWRVSNGGRSLLVSLCRAPISHAHAPIA